MSSPQPPAEEPSEAMSRHQIYRAKAKLNPMWVLKERQRFRLKARKMAAEGKIDRRKFSEFPKRAALSKARSKVQHATTSGALVRKPCEVCGEKLVEAHHDDYSKPLEVRWLCKKHHMEHHVRERERKLLGV